MANTNSSTINTQLLINYVRAVYEKSTATVGLAGYDDEPALSFAQDIVQKIMNPNNPWKWNSYPFPPFYTQPLQQDYPTSVSQNSLGWLENCTMIGINDTGSQPLPQPPVRAVARLLPTSLTGDPGQICWIPNRNAITGQWPGAGAVYITPVAALGGGPGNNPLTAITDTNGNIQVVTQYGTTGGSQPVWPSAGASAGTVTNDGTVKWTVQDPNGVALRLDALATYGSFVWQLIPFYQQKPPLITTLNQTFDPIPDDLQYLIKQGFLAWCYKKGDPKNFASEYMQWKEDIQEAMGASDREPQEFGIYPSQGIATGGNIGAGYSYPGWPGWTNQGT